MNTNNLIKDLANDEMEVISIGKPFIFIVKYFGVSIVFITLFLYIMPPRIDIFNNIALLFELILTSSIIIISGISACMGAYPQLNKCLYFNKLTILMLLLFIGEQLYFFIIEYASTYPDIGDLFILGKGINCSCEIAIFTTIASIIMFFMLHRGFFVNPNVTSKNAAISAVFTGYLILRLIERRDDYLHIFIWHSLPLIFLLIIFTYIGDKRLRKI